MVALDTKLAGAERVDEMLNWPGLKGLMKC